MKKTFYFLLIIFSSLATLYAQDDAAMNAWTDFMTPGDMHKWMAKAEGTWTGDVNTYMDPANPTKSTVSATYKMLYNGLFQSGEMKGDMMGQAFEGQGILAYDNAKKQFVNTWIDNMGSGVIYMTGEFDTKTNTLHLKGTQTDPMTQKDSHIRQEIKFLNDDTQSTTMYGFGMDGKEMLMMDIVLRRVK
ncbi:MAG TPA: DUF1579 domain-containing protein [Saprospiraceae bacterium]|nr:DUF1579 domain-containing protein [Saprospiraceae bacterium]